MPPIALRHHLAPLLAHLVTSDAGERDQQDVQHLADDLRVFLATPLHRIDQISGVVAIAEWLGSLDARTRAALALDSTLTSTIDRVIDHLLAIPAPGLLRCFLEECDAEIPTTKKRTARKLMVEAEQRGRAIVADRLERRDESEGTEGTEEERQLSMIGEIAVTMPGAPERSPVRGAGIKRALGTLVADRMLDRPMDFAEIARLVGGDETTDAERGRKLVNNAVYKIRKLLGNDAIEADRGSVRLRDEVIAIDLLALDRSLKSATAAIDGGNIAPALDDLRHSLALFGQGPVWPGLYDPFFEAARSELEWRLRSTLLRGATALAEAGDPAGATHLLELGRTAMPGDEEIVEQLVAMLERQGKFVEAERLRMDNEAV